MYLYIKDLQKTAITKESKWAVVVLFFSTFPGNDFLPAFATTTGLSGTVTKQFPLQLLYLPVSNSAFWQARSSLTDTRSCFQTRSIKSELSFPVQTYFRGEIYFCTADTWCWGWSRTQHIADLIHPSCSVRSSGKRSRETFSIRCDCQHHTYVCMK